MNESWTTAVAVVLVTLGVLAALNLIRLFLADWREDRRHARPRSPESARQPTSPASALHDDSRRPIGYRLAACSLAPTLFAAGALAQGGAPAAQPTTPPAEKASAPGESAPSPQPAPADAAQAEKSPFSLQLNLDYTTAYFYHGIIQEDSGLILQPAARLTVNLYQQDDFKIDGILGVWNSFHGQKTGATTRGDFTEYWYEADLIGGFAITKDKFSLTTTYTFLTSPSDAYETVQELDFTLAYDDADLLGKLALHPYVLLGVETGADASDGADSDTGTYLELGIAPGFSFDVESTPIAISFPVSVGLSLDNYYQDAAGEDDTFGFAQVGVKASIPLPFGDRYGKWTLNTGVSAMYLGDHTAEYNGGDDTEFIATLGLQLSF